MQTKAQVSKGTSNSSPHFKPNGHFSAEYIAKSLDRNGKKNGTDWMVRCPVHADRTASLSLSESPSGKILWHCFGGCSQEDIREALESLGLLPSKNSHRTPVVSIDAVEELRKKRARKYPADAEADVDDDESDDVRQKRKEVARYNYVDEHGKLLYQTLRFAPKDFRQRQPDGNGGWNWNLQHVRKVLYRLPEVIQAKTIYIVEGEKDVKTIMKLGRAATCNPMGAGKWKDEYSTFLKGKCVIIIPDNDDPGTKHAQDVARSVMPLAKWVKVVEVPAPAKDITDWVKAGGTKPQLIALVRKAHKWTDPGPRHIGRIEDIPWIGDVASADIDWIVKGLLAAGTITLFTGDFGTGKSTFATDMVYCVSQGLEVLGQTTRPRAVLILDAENPAVAIMDRLKRLGIEKKNNLHIWGQWVGEEPPTAGGPLVLEWVSRTYPKPIIVADSLAGFHEGDENNAADIEVHMKQYRALTAMGATVILLHNNNRAGNFRGSARIMDAVDVCYEITRQGTDATRLNLLQLDAKKLRITVEPRLLIRYHDGEFHREDPENPETEEDRLAALLWKNGGIGKVAFLRLAMQHRHTRQQADDFLEQNKLIRTRNAGRNKRQYYWKWLPNDDEDCDT